jgi:hypothetical protein
MTENEFLDNFIPDRLRIIVDDPNPKYIYALLRKHLCDSIPNLEERFNVSIHSIRREVTISGGYADISELFEYLGRFGVNFISITPLKLVIDLDHFITKIY